MENVQDRSLAFKTNKACKLKRRIIEPLWELRENVPPYSVKENTHTNNNKNKNKIGLFLEGEEMNKCVSNKYFIESK